MTYVQVHCPDCQGVNVVQYGKQRHGPQRYQCNNVDCPRRIFLLQYQNQAPPPCGETTNSGHGAERQWDPRYGPGLRVSPATVIDTLKLGFGH